VLLETTTRSHHFRLPPGKRLARHRGNRKAARGIRCRNSSIPHERRYAWERLREAQESEHHLLHKPVWPMRLRAMLNQILKTPQVAGANGD